MEPWLPLFQGSLNTSPCQKVTLASVGLTLSKEITSVRDGCGYTLTFLPPTSLLRTVKGHQVRNMLKINQLQGRTNG